MGTTNVRPEQLNYDKYASSRYDRDIVLTIPFHTEIHKLIKKFIIANYKVQDKLGVLDLGAGTGITSKLITGLLPNSNLTVVDFSKKMLGGARKKLGIKNIRYLLGDYSKLNFTVKYDIVVSVIGIHHQNTSGKKKLFKKIFKLLKPNGVFIFGDLVTYKDKEKAALNQALHLYNLVKNATNKKMLTEWAYHHLYLNDLAPIENQLKWLNGFGFKTNLKFLKFNTALVICTKKDF